MGDFDDIPGGEYRRAPNLYLEVEFGWLNRDMVTYTDNYGRYQVTKGTPWWGSYSVDVEVRAEILLDTSDSDGPNLVDMYPAGTDFWLFYEGRLNWYPYNGQTGTASVGDGETVTMDVYIGGPGVRAVRHAAEERAAYAPPGDAGRNRMGFIRKGSARRKRIAKEWRESEKDKSIDLDHAESAAIITCTFLKI